MKTGTKRVTILNGDAEEKVYDLSWEIDQEKGEISCTSLKDALGAECKDDVDSSDLEEEMEEILMEENKPEPANTANAGDDGN